MTARQEWLASFAAALAMVALIATLMWVAGLMHPAYALGAAHRKPPVRIEHVKVRSHKHHAEATR